MELIQDFHSRLIGNYYLSEQIASYVIPVTPLLLNEGSLTNAYNIKYIILIHFSHFLQGACFKDCLQIFLQIGFKI